MSAGQDQHIFWLLVADGTFIGLLTHGNFEIERAVMIIMVDIKEKAIEERSQLEQLKILEYLSMVSLYQYYIQMGATTQKSIKNIIEAKYSFSHPKSRAPIHLSLWKYTEEELEKHANPPGLSLKWPFKFYSDEGYILALIENRAAINTLKEGAKPGSIEPWALLKELRATLSVMQILYSFYNAEIEEYFQDQIVIESDSKFLKDQLNLCIYVYAGQNLSSVAKLKLMTHAISLERYIARGGLCSISKLYHEYETISDLTKQIRLETEVQKSKEDEYYVAVSTLAEDKLKLLGIEDKAELEKTVLSQLWDQLQKFSSLNRIIFNSFVPAQRLVKSLMHQGNVQIYPILDGSIWSTHKNLIISPALSKDQQVQKKATEQIAHFRQKELDLNDSSPFQCEITEINFNAKKKAPFNQDSNLIEDLSVLNHNKSTQFLTIVCPEQDYLILTNYASLRQYKKLVDLNVRLVINLAPSACFNYYLNDLQYLHYYLAALPSKIPADAVLFENNIEHIILGASHSIINHTLSNKPKDGFNNRVAVHSAGALFSDQNCALIIGYLIVRYLYTYEKAFKLLSGLYYEYKEDKNLSLSIHKVYVDQLLTLEGRVLITSSPNYGVSLNATHWKVFQISNNHSSIGQELIPRFIGQLSNLNQLTSLPNYNHHFYIVLSHQLASVLLPIVEKWEKDPGMNPPQGITGIKVLVGKQFQFKDIFISKSKQLIPLMLKYELLNRNKCQKSFNNQFLFKFIQGIVEANLQIEVIEKSFRKPVPLNPIYSGFQQESPISPIQKVPLPYNPKEKITFKYPFLRPIWQPLKDDQYYFILQVTKSGASLQVVKGKNWAGYEVDKQAFFVNIVELYLQNIDESKIWINEEGEQSLFGDQLNL